MRCQKGIKRRVKLRQVGSEVDQVLDIRLGCLDAVQARLHFVRHFPEQSAVEGFHGALVSVNAVRDFSPRAGVGGAGQNRAEMAAMIGLRWDAS